MNNLDLTFNIFGKDAKSTAEEIKNLIENEFNTQTVIISDKEKFQTEQTKVIDQIAVGALIIAIPGSILAVSQLVDRIRNRNKLDKVFEQTQKVIEKKETTDESYAPVKKSEVSK